MYKGKTKKVFFQYEYNSCYDAHTNVCNVVCDSNNIANTPKTIDL